MYFGSFSDKSETFDQVDFKQVTHCTAALSGQPGSGQPGIAGNQV
jgi:hypothetical protein